MASPSNTASGNTTTSRDQLPRSFWFIAICGFVTGGFVALGERGEQLAAAKAEQSAVAPGNAGVRQERWRVPPPVSSRVASAGISVPVSAPSAGTPLAMPGSKVENPGTKPPSPTSRMAVVMLILGVLGAGALWAAKKRGGVFGEAQEKRLAVVETARIGGRFQVALVKAPGRMLVLGASEKGLTLLTELEADVDDGVNVPTFDIALEAASLPEYAVSGGRGIAGELHGQPEKRTQGAVVASGPPQQQPAEETAEMGEQFLDHLVDRLNAAKPRGLDHALEQPRPAGGPLARYRRSLA